MNPPNILPTMTGPKEIAELRQAHTPFDCEHALGAMPCDA